MKYLFIIICLIVCQSCFLLTSSQKKQLKQVESVKPIDVVIIPGLPLYNGKWDTLLMSRILWSVFLYKKGLVSNIIFSGNAVYTPWVESTSMALYANQLGISKEHIFTDTIAEHSTENLFYGYQLAKQQGFKTVALASDPFQCKILQKYAKKNFNEPIYFLPIVYDSIRNKMHTQIDIDSVITRKTNFVSIEKRQGYKERINGTRGKHIKKED